jgi:succinoglycan biosynthesis transport protein ExoP
MSTESHAEHGAGLRPEYVREVWQRRKWIAIGVCVAVYAAATTVASSLPDLYQASATVLIERPQISEEFVPRAVTAELETRLQTIHQRVMSRERLAEVITQLGLYPELRGAPITALVGRMRADIIPLQLRSAETATGYPTTIAFTIGFRGRDPNTVARVTNTLAGLFAEENSKARERQAAGTVDFLSGQLADVKREVDIQERLSNEFTLQYSDELPQQLEANLAALDRLNTQLRLNGEYQLRALERRERLEEELTAAATAAVPAAPGEVEPVDPKAELRRLRRQLGELRRRFSEEYPDVRRVTTEIAALEGQIAAEDIGGSEPAAAETTNARREIARLDAEIADLRQQDAVLRGTIGAYERRVENAPRRQSQIQQLSRGYDIAKERYQTLLKRYEDAQLAEQIEQGQSAEQFRVLDPAIPPASPSAPNRQWLRLMGLALALGLAFGAVFAAERIDTTFHTADDLRAFIDVPALISIRRVMTRADVRRRRVRLAVVAASAIVGLGLVIGGSYYIAAGNEQMVRLTARGGM